MPQRKRQTKLSADDIVTWAAHASGMATKDIAAKQGVTSSAINFRIARIKKFIEKEGGDFDINAYRLPMYGFFDLFVNSIQSNLLQHDVTTQNAYAKGMGIYQDKQQLEVKIDVKRIDDADLATEAGTIIAEAESIIARETDSVGGDNPGTKTA